MKKLTDLNKHIELINYKKGDKWNETFTVVENYGIALTIAETFKNGNFKKSTIHYVYADGKVIKV